MDYNDLYFAGDARNAVKVVGRSENNNGRNPRATVVHGAPVMSPYGGASQYGNPYSANAMIGAHYVMTPHGPMLAQQQSGAFEGIDAGEWVDIAAQVVSALLPLPDAPPSTTVVEDNAQNMVSYQTALASYAKRDEQLRTLGSLVKTFLRGR